MYWRRERVAYNVLVEAKIGTQLDFSLSNREPESQRERVRERESMCVCVCVNE
jgi:hypothetical protein